VIGGLTRHDSSLGHHDLFLESAVLTEGEDVTLVIYCSDGVNISMFTGKQFFRHVLHTPSLFSVFGSVVPKQAHHHFSCGY
jgi:hypothetical protein